MLALIGVLGFIVSKSRAASANFICVPTVYNVTSSAPPPLGNWTDTSGAVWTPAGGFPGCATGDSAADTNGTPTVLIINSAIPNPISGPNLTCAGCTIDIQSGGSLTLAGSGTLGSATTIIVEPGGTLTIANGGTLTVNSGASLSVNGGHADVQPGGQLTLNGASTVTNGGTLNLGGGGLTVSNLFTIQSTGTVAVGADTSVNGTGTIHFVGSSGGGAVLQLDHDLTVNASVSLTMDAGATSTGTGDVIGSVKRTGFVSTPTPNTLSFGNPNNQITITAGTPPTDITVNLVKSAPAIFPSAVQRTYTITPTGGSGITATLRLHYLDGELAGNTPESSLNLLKYDGTSLAVVPPTTSVDTTDNWVENNSVQSFSTWTFSTCAQVVANTADSGAGSLRQAVIDSCPGGTITFDTAGVFATPQTITLTSGEIVIDRSLTITGPANVLTVSGNNASRVFKISPGKSANISGLTIANGNVTNNAYPDDSGGGIVNDHGTLTLSDCVLSNNKAQSSLGVGGAIYNNSKSGGPATLTINNSVLSGNISRAGGAIFNDGDAGGIATVTINNSTLSDNNTGPGSGSGGAIYSRGNGGNGFNGMATLNLNSSTINGNQAGTYGGGVFNVCQTVGSDTGTCIVNINSSTISRNTAAGGGLGGGFYNDNQSSATATLTISNSTVSGNSAGAGGGINNSGGTVPLNSTIVSNNSGSLGPDISNNNGGSISGSYNLVQTITGYSFSSGANNIFNQDPLLAKANDGKPLLQNNGGPTMTIGFTGGSPAMDAGNDANAPATDQRGFNRVVDGPDADTTARVDIGAFEAQTSVEDITDRSTNEDTQLQFTFNLGGSINSVTATSSNTTLVPNNPANISVTGSGSTRTLTINPAANQFGTSTITVTVNGNNSQSMIDTFVLTVNAVADTPSVTNATTNEDTQTTSGLVISRNAFDGAEVTHFKISSITGGTVFKNDGVTAIANNQFITFAEGSAGLKFTPAANLFSPSTAFSFQLQGATSDTGSGLSSGFATATITVDPVADTPSVTNATTTVNTQSTSGLVISRNAADGSEVTNFKITNITGGTLFKNDGTTQITNSQFITFAEGNAGLKFTPALNSNANGSFQVQASLSNDDSGLGGGLATATITVNCGSTIVLNSNDSGAGSLRTTILQACDGATITFQAGLSNVTLTSAELLIDKNLTITGPGANLLTVMRSSAGGTPNFRIFTINNGQTVTMSGLTIANGMVSSGNPATGGGIYNNGGTLTLTNSTLSGNSASGSSNNNGGGIANFGGTLTLTNSTLSGNSASGGSNNFGGGIYNSLGTVTLTNSTLSGNSASGGMGNGGGIFTNSTLTITNSTLSGNSAIGSGGSTNQGGGIRTDGTLTLTNSTVSGNSVSGGTNNFGGGILRGGGTAQFRNSIVALNAATSGPDLSGIFTSNGRNLIGKNSGASITTAPGASGDLIGTNASPVNPVLSSLANYGGPTQTLALLPGSPALNAGDNCVTQAAHCGDPNISQLTTDQRGGGFNRIVGASVDIGAFESKGFTISAVGGTPQSTTILTAFGSPITASVVSVAPEPVDGGVVTFTAPSSGPSATFTGGVTTINAAINASGQANASPTANNSAGGPYNVTATGIGISSAANFSLTNIKANQTITFNTLSDKNFGDADFNVSATASSGLAVSFTASGNCTISTNTVHLTGAGLCTVTAKQAGNSDFNAAPDVPRSFNIAKATSTTAVSSSANPSNFSQTVTFTATVTGPAGTGTPSGSITFKDGGSAITCLNAGGQTLNSSGVATCQTSTLTAGAHIITTDYSGDTNFSASTGALSPNQVVNNVPVVNFSAATYTVNESDGVVHVVVNRGGDTSVAFNVDYATDDTGASTNCGALNSGLASARCDYTTLLGTLKFAANQTTATLDISINQDSYTEGPESFTVSLSNATNGALLITPSSATVTINDSAPPAGTTNAIDDTTDFVRQQYHDFLNREPDAPGLAFWVNGLNECNDPSKRPAGQTQAQCIEVRRILTSGAFFLSIEFMQTGTFVRSFYVAALNRPNAPSAADPTANMPGFTEWLRDTQAVQRGVIVGQGSWQATLDANRNAFMADFVTRAEFVGLYPTNDTPTQYINKLYQHALSRAPSTTELNDGLSMFGGDTTASDPAKRGQALLKVTQRPDFISRETNRAFVQVEYFGYLRRNPNEAPDIDFSGFNFWVNKINAFTGDFLQAEMVKAFINSNEYRRRFGP
jgi:hypothetical protein